MFDTTIAGSLPKPAWLAEPNRLWVVIIILLPTLGGILYLVFGRADNQVSQAAR
jgi:hypothetical protein